MLPGLFLASTVFTSLVCVRFSRAVHVGDTRLCSQQENRHKKRRKTKMLMSTERLKINVTAPPEGTVFIGQLFESGSRPSRKVSGGVRRCVGNFSHHCTPEQRFQSQPDNGPFEGYSWRWEAGR